MTERRVYGATLSKVADSHARGIIKAAEINSHVVAVEHSAKIKRVDAADKWVVAMQTLVENEMRARGLPVSTAVIGMMRGLVKKAYKYGKDAIMDEARERLGPYFPIFEKYIDQWLMDYSEIRTIEGGGRASDRLINRVRLGGYSKRVEIELLPPEEVSNGISARYDERSAPYRSASEQIKLALGHVPDYVRGEVRAAAMRLFRDVYDYKISTARAEYMMYKKVLKELGADGYLDDALKALGIYDEIVGGTARGGETGGSTP